MTNANQSNTMKSIGFEFLTRSNLSVSAMRQCCRYLPPPLLNHYFNTRFQHCRSNLPNSIKHLLVLKLVTYNLRLSSNTNSV